MANLLTTIRLGLIVPLAMAFADPGFLSSAMLALGLSLAIASDYLDGKAARYFGTASARGMLFDHGTDFLFVTACLAGLAVQGQVSFLLPVFITIAFSQYVIDSYFLYRQKQLRMSMLGRWNGILYFVPLVAVVIARLSDGAVSGFAYGVVQVLGYGLLLSTLASIVDRGLAPFRTPNKTPNS